MTTNTPWTPGPWHPSGTRILGKSGTRNTYVADISRDVPVDVAKANAQLIALAPEMAEALAEAETAFAALLFAQAVHPRAVLNRPDCIAATDLCDKALTQARAILARLPQKGGEK